METGAIKVLFICDHPITCLGLRVLLSEAEDIEIVGEFSSRAGVPEQVNALQPDLILLDCYLSDLGEENLAAAFAAQGLPARLLVFSPILDEQHLRRMLEAGVTGYLLRTEAPEAILQAVRATSRGELWLSARLAQIVAGWWRGEEPPPPPELTEREREVLRLMAQGKHNVEIAETLGIAVGTVKNYVASIYDKLGAHNRVEAVLWALRQRLVEVC
jgi:DNA-binding NarL/FixJ family response regulator